MLMTPFNTFLQFVAIERVTQIHGTRRGTTEVQQTRSFVYV